MWGAPRIHGELLKLGFEIAESTVSKHDKAPRTAIADLADFCATRGTTGRQSSTPPVAVRPSALRCAAKR